MKGVATLPSTIASFALALLLVLGLSACAELWGPMNDPADPKAQAYQGYETVKNPDAIASVSPADGATLVGTLLSTNKVAGATAYELRLATSAAGLEASPPFFTKPDYPSNLMDIATSGIQNATSYWWQARARVGTTTGAWSSPVSFTTNFQPAATPTFSPAEGTFASDQSVTISCATAGASIYYTVDGSAPTPASTHYTSPISVAGDGRVQEIQAISVAPLYAASAVGKGTFTIAYLPAETPTFNPVAGTYDSDQSVTISCATVGASIYYTMDGGTPTAASTLYAGAISVAGNGTARTIRAIAMAEGVAASSVGSALYTIAYGAAPTPTFSPSPGNFPSDQSVTINCTAAGASIFYTIDGSVPTTASTPYDGAFSVAGTGTTKTIKAIATAEGYITSAVGTGVYTINYPTAATPTFSPVAGTFNSDQSVTINCATSGASMYYTLDGTTPTTSSALYSSALGIAGHGTSKTIKAIAAGSGLITSSAGSATYLILYSAAPTPTFSPSPGTYTTDQSVSLDCTAPGASIFYTTDGSTPTTASTPYSGAISAAGTGTIQTIKAIATAMGYLTSAVGEGVFTINYPAAATPIFSPSGGRYTSDQSVLIVCTTSNATIWYTTDGSDPTNSSTRQSGASPIGPLAAKVYLYTTIRAIAEAPLYSTSAEGSGTYKDNIYRLGDLGPAGGIVVYDKTVYSDGWRYFEVAPSDQGFSFWANWAYLQSIYTEYGIGSGKANTESIAPSTPNDNAAKICLNLTINGFNDWYLPSFDELYIVYSQKTNIPNIVVDSYWSSSGSINPNDPAWYLNFADGNWYLYSKSNLLRFRAIRYF